MDKHNWNFSFYELYHVYSLRIKQIMQTWMDKIFKKTIYTLYQSAPDSINQYQTFNQKSHSLTEIFVD